jgi:hypothetical protein
MVVYIILWFSNPLPWLFDSVPCIPNLNLSSYTLRALQWLTLLQTLLLQMLKFNMVPIFSICAAEASTEVQYGKGGSANKNHNYKHHLCVS